jgi:SCY1-like protein 1
VHGSLKVASVYTTESGEWKLGGFEVLSNVKDDDAVVYVGHRPSIRFGTFRG